MFLLKFLDTVYAKSQPRTGHTREPDPTHNELKHTITRKTATHERNPDTPAHVYSERSRGGERGLPNRILIWKELD